MRPTGERDAEHRRRFGDLDAAMENDKQVTRRMVLELREQTVRLHDLGHGIQAQHGGPAEGAWTSCGAGMGPATAA